VVIRNNHRTQVGHSTNIPIKIDILPVRAQGYFIARFLHKVVNIMERREAPEGSKIKVEQDVHSTSFVWKDVERKSAKVRQLVFSIFLITFSASFLVLVIRHFVDGTDRWHLGGPLILALILAILCMVGGFFFLFLSLRPTRPFKLVLSPRNIRYEIGDFSFRSINAHKMQDLGEIAAWMKKYRQRIYEAETSKVTNLKLERVGDKIRLSFDLGVDRVEIGETLSDREKEWLHEILREHKQH